jgi:hypothetical protein
MKILRLYVDMKKRELEDNDFGWMEEIFWRNSSQKFVGAMTRCECGSEGAMTFRRIRRKRL